jgi:quercetin dioxygenase-like cupin family protein
MNPVSTVKTAPLDPLVTAAGAGRVLDFPLFGHRVVIKVPSAATGGAFSVAEVIAQPGGGVPLHSHDREEETFCVLNGHFLFEVGDKTIEAGPGDMIFGARQVAHSWRCVGDTEGRLFALFSPGAFEDFLLGLTDALPPADPASEAVMAALCAHYGIHFGETTATAAAPFVPSYVPAGEGPYFDMGDHRVWGKVGSAQTGGAFLLAEVEADPGAGVPPHIHSREDETFFILSGRFALAVGDRMIEAGPGDTVFAPRNLPHAWQCVGETAGRLLALITPGANFEAFSAEMAAGGALVGDAMATPASAAAFMAITARYGIEMLPQIK